MKYFLWILGLALGLATFNACGDSSTSSSNEIASYKKISELPEECDMDVVRISDTYYVCFENNWEKLMDSSIIIQIKEISDKEEIGPILEELKNHSEKSSNDKMDSVVSILSSSGDALHSKSSSSSTKEKNSSGNFFDSSSSSESNVDDEFDDLSSSFEESSSSAFWLWGMKKDDLLNPNIAYGEMIDARDGKKYKTVSVGSQTWMAENLNYSDSIATPSLKGKMWCHEFDENCELAGAYYTWTAAIDSVYLYEKKGLDCGNDKHCVLPDVVQGACPSGWHLPNRDEWEILFANVGGDYNDMRNVWENTSHNLKSQLAWEDDDTPSETEDIYGFSAIPFGYRTGSHNFMFAKGVFEGYAYDASFWTATEFSDIYAIFINMRCEDDDVIGQTAIKDYGFSIRCIENSN